MSNHLREIGEYIIENYGEIAKIGHQMMLEEDPEMAKKAASVTLKSMTPEELAEFTKKFYVYFGEALFSDPKISFQKITEWGEQAGALAVKENLALDESLDRLRFSRKAIWQIIKEKIKTSDISAEEVVDIASIIDPLLDRTIYCYSLAYVNQSKREMKLAQEAIHELSVPVVPVAEGVAVLPIVGGIDTHRSKYLMEVALRRSVELQLQQLLIDLSGVPVIDTMVAQNLFHVVNALRLLGVKTTLTGIRPELAQTVVSLGIDFEGVSTIASLQQALAMIGFDKN